MRPLGPRRRGAFTPAVILTLLLLAGCTAAGATSAPTVGAVPATLAPTAAPTATPAAFPTIVTDDEGTAVTVAAEPRKIVSLTPAATEILYAIGAGDRVVAKVEDVAGFPPAAASLPIVATFKGVDIEKIVALDADLVVSGGANFGQGDAVEQLRKAKVPVVVVNPTSTSGVLKDIHFIGQAAGESANANAVAEAMQTDFDTIRTATASVAHPKVFYETGNQPAIYGIADNSLYAEMIQLAGGDPVTTGSTTNYEMPLERLVSANPDVILLGDSAYGVTVDEVKARSGWKTIKAVQSGAVYPIDDIVVTRPGPRLVDGLLALVNAIHPEMAIASFGPIDLPNPVPAISGGSIP